MKGALATGRATPSPPPQRSELAPMLRQLHLLVSAAVPLDRTLRALQQGTWAPCVQRWRAGILMGNPLSQAMASQPGALRRDHLKLVRLGERFGRLDDCLGYLAELEEKRHALTCRVQAALIYPIFLMALVTLMVVFLPPTFLHSILGMLSHQGGSLPWPTRTTCARIRSIADSSATRTTPIQFALLAWPYYSEESAARQAKVEKW